jgi:hypothetical protein
VANARGRTIYYLALAALLVLAAWSVRSLDDSRRYYVGLVLLVLAMVVALVKAYDVWEEIHDEEEPDSPADLLGAFEKAHAAGVLDDEELERVRDRLQHEGESKAQPVSRLVRGSNQPRPATGGPADAGSADAAASTPGPDGS